MDFYLAFVASVVADVGVHCCDDNFVVFHVRVGGDDIVLVVILLEKLASGTSLVDDEPADVVYDDFALFAAVVATLVVEAADVGAVLDVSAFGFDC